MSTVTTIGLRPATSEDARLIFNWRNDPVIVRLGSSQREVTWAEHEKWFSQSISSRERRIFIVEKDGLAIGQVRFDRASVTECVISVYLGREFTGHGWGVEAMRIGCEMIFTLWPVERVSAWVREENRASQSAVRKVGFKQVNERCGLDQQEFQLLRSEI